MNEENTFRVLALVLRDTDVRNRAQNGVGSSSGLGRRSRHLSELDSDND